MWLRVLGSAAGGGFPQWNCDCPTCRAVRDGSRPCRPRTQSSIAVSADREHWYLINASPDIRAQLEAFPALHPRRGRDRGRDRGRETPLETVLLTDAELDHTLGLLLLREGRGIEVHATAAVHDTLRDGTSLLRILDAYCPVKWYPVIPGTDVPLGNGLSYRAFDVPTSKRARFGTGSAGTGSTSTGSTGKGSTGNGSAGNGSAGSGSAGAGTGEGRVIGYRLTDESSGRAVVYLPSVQRLTPGVRDQLNGCACLLIDGTCWHDDELIRLGLAGKTAHEMGHLPIDGPGGSLAQLSPLPIERKIYIHINNTNPILLDDSAERQAVERHGMEVAMDGLELQV